MDCLCRRGGDVTNGAYFPIQSFSVSYTKVFLLTCSKDKWHGKTIPSTDLWLLVILNQRPKQLPTEISESLLWPTFFQIQKSQVFLLRATLLCLGSFLCLTFVIVLYPDYFVFPLS